MSEGLLSALENATLLKSREGFPSIYQLKLTPLETSEGGMFRRVLVGVGNPEAHTKRDIVVLVAGQRGHGKTTWINGFANFLYGVNWHDPFRVVVAGKESTKSVTAYRFEWQPWFPVPGNVVLIDTPGFEDLEEPDEVRKTVEAIELFSMLAVDQPNVVAFFMQGSQHRLWVPQHYVFDVLVDMFGNDVKGNFTVVATFTPYQSHRRDFLSQLKLLLDTRAPELPVKDIYGFENFALFCENDPTEPEFENDWKEMVRSYAFFAEKNCFCFKK